MKVLWILGTVLALCTQVQGHSLRDPASLFITSEGALSEPIVNLLKLDGLETPSSLSESLPLIQEHWIAIKQGKNGKERADLGDTPEQFAQREQVQKIVRSMGLFDAKGPQLAHYDYGVLLGGLLDGVRLRLAELVKAWQQGVRMDKIVILTGERTLRKGPGQDEQLSKLCDASSSPLPFKKGWTLPPNANYDTEYDMVKWVWDQVELPEEMAKALEGRVLFVNAPRGVNERPGTKDTYQVWLKDYQPTPGSVIAFSSPLLWCYQQLAGANILGPDWVLDTVAPAATRDNYYRVSLIHDTLAKCLYEISGSR